MVFGIIDYLLCLISYAAINTQLHKHPVEDPTQLHKWPVEEVIQEVNRALFDVLSVHIFISLGI